MLSVSKSIKYVCETQLKRSLSAFKHTNEKNKSGKSNKYQKSPGLKGGVNKFEDEILLRRLQAKKSVLVKVETNSDLNCLLDDLNKIGTNVENVFLLGDENLTSRSALIEFQTNSCVENLLNNYGQHFANNEHLPCKTRLFLYRSHRANFEPRNNNFNIVRSIINQKEDLNSRSIDPKKKFSFLNSVKNSNEQILKIYDHFKIDEAGYRIRYFIASIVEESFHSLFKNCICLPFGSSANRFGHRGSDLDLLFSLDNKFYNSEQFQTQNPTRLNGKIIFFSKFAQNDQERNLAKNFLELAYFILGNILPKFSVKQLIKTARVPILEFDFELPSKQKLNCDLSMSNLKVSYQMTKLFWTYTQMDTRVAPLIFLIKYWASLANVTNTFRPSPNITNFQLTVLILNFLLRLENPLILPLESITSYIKSTNLTKSVDEELKYTVNDSLTISELKAMVKTKNQISLKDLLLGFFNFYSNFDFESNMISLSRNLELKTNQFKNEALVIVNPFMPELNASKNVNKQNLEKFSFVCNESYEWIKANSKDSGDNFDLVEFFNFISAQTKKFKNESFETNSLADEMNSRK